MLYERTALSKKPAELIRNELSTLRKIERFLLELGAGFFFRRTPGATFRACSRRKKAYQRGRCRGLVDLSKHLA